MRDGVLQYQCSCPGGNTVHGESGALYTSQPGSFVMGPTEIQSIDPLGIGPNLYMLGYFQKTYAGLSGNDSSVGDGFNYVGYRFRAPVSFDTNVFISRADCHLTAHLKHTVCVRASFYNISH